MLDNLNSKTVFGPFLIIPGESCQNSNPKIYPIILMLFPSSSAAHPTRDIIDILLEDINVKNISVKMYSLVKVHQFYHFTFLSKFYNTAMNVTEKRCKR